MVETLTMPKLSPTMEEGTLVAWHKAEGDYVESGDLLFEVATDKATVEYHALDSGYLRKQLVAQGDLAQVNQLVALFTEEKDEDITGFAIPQVVSEEETEKETGEAKPVSETSNQPRAGKKTSSTISQPIFPLVDPLENWSFEFPATDSYLNVKASPYAKKIAKEQGIDLSSIKGSGPGGRIVSDDLKHAHGAKLSMGSRALPSKAPGSYHRETMSHVRKVIAQRLAQSKTFIPHFYVRMQVQMDSLLNLRAQLKTVDFRITVNDLILRAVALALKEHPNVNSGFDSATEEVIRFETIDLSVAVSLADGLITPIIRHADAKNVQQISQQVRHLVSKAKESKLKPEEFQGGSFTVSNLGMFGVSDFQAIINPPQAAILSVSAALERVQLVDGEVKNIHEMNLSLSCDHRVIDGADAARFLQTLKKLIENPAVLLLN